MPRLVPPVITAGALGATAQPVLGIGDGVRARPWEARDRAALVAAFADPEIQRWHLVRLDSPLEADEWITATQTGWTTETVASWAIVGDGPNTVLERISLYFKDLRNGIGEVTYWVVLEARGRGLASMAVDAVSSWAFDQAGLHRIELAHSVHNPASCRVAAKAGFGEEGVRISARKHPDRVARHARPQPSRPHRVVAPSRRSGTLRCSRLGLVASEPSEPAEPEVWRVSTLGRASGYLVAVALAAVGVAMAIAAVLTAELGLAVGFVGLAAVGFVLPAFVAFRFLSRAQVILTPNDLTVTTTFNEYRVDWADVLGATAGYSGVTILSRNRPAIVSGAVQKSNLATWLNRQTRADDLAEEINARRARP